MQLKSVLPIFVVLYSFFFPFVAEINAQSNSFTFIGMTDTNSGTSTQLTLANKAQALNPAFVIFTGDTLNSGVDVATLDTWTASMAPIMAKTFPVRGNHDNVFAPNALPAWNAYFNFSAVAASVGASNYQYLNSQPNSTYSFDYQNSHFVGIDVPGDAPAITSSQVNWLNTDLAAAESRGLTHAFIYFHGPVYCMGGSHCSYTTKLAYSTSSVMNELYSVINNHPIVTAFIHGHEHHFSYSYIDSNRITPITHPFYEFVMGNSGGDYRACNANRCDYTYVGTTSTHGFVMFKVNGPTITVDWLVNGNSPPAHTYTFTKIGVPTPAPPSPSPTPGGNTRPTKYYGVDRVRSNTDFATLASWGINTAVVAISTGGSTSTWQPVYDAASAAGVNIVIWPLDPGGDNNCGWESPFNAPVNGNYISKVTNLLTWWANKPGVAGIVTFHEPMWSSSSGCKDNISDLSAIYSQIHAYTNNPAFEIYGYINTLNTSTIKNGDGSGTGISDYTGPVDLARIMDVATIWQHCAGRAEGPCEGPNSALFRINEARTILTSVQSPVKSLFLQQTFTMSGGYTTKFTPDELYQYSCDFLNTGALDGFAYYTWDEGWYSSNLKSWTSQDSSYVTQLQNIYRDCVNKSSPLSPTPTSTAKLGDYDHDGDVDFIDLKLFLIQFTTIFDFNRLIQSF